MLHVVCCTRAARCMPYGIRCMLERKAHCAELKAVFRFYCVPTLRERNELTVSRAQVRACLAGDYWRISPGLWMCAGTGGYWGLGVLRVLRAPAHVLTGTGWATAGTGTVGCVRACVRACVRVSRLVRSTASTRAQASESAHARTLSWVQIDLRAAAVCAVLPRLPLLRAAPEPGGRHGPRDLRARDRAVRPGCAYVSTTCRVQRGVQHAAYHVACTGAASRSSPSV
jgi:hypothetical protein